MIPHVHPFLTQPDLVVLSNLSRDVHTADKPELPLSQDDPKENLPDDKAAVQILTDFNDETSKNFQPTVFTGWDQKDIPKTIQRYLVQPYTTWAKPIVRRPTDVVFLTHIIIYLTTSVPSALKNKKSLALRTLGSELSSYAFIGLMATWNLRATIFVLVIPLVQMRVGMMVGNWGQHALVDEVEPDSDFRSSITLIDVPVSGLENSRSSMRTQGAIPYFFA
ncbi:MAG: hypothetical protein Q9182_007374 [Xanthomendoza sp. 2 TL-2023]